MSTHATVLMMLTLPGTDNDDLYLVGAPNRLATFRLDTIISAGFTPQRLAAEREVCDWHSICCRRGIRIASVVYVNAYRGSHCDALGKLCPILRNQKERRDESGWPCAER